MKFICYAMLLVCSLLCLACRNSGNGANSRASIATQGNAVSVDWINGEWVVENGTRLAFRRNGTFRQLYLATQSAPPQVIFNEESANQAKLTGKAVPVEGKYQLLDLNRMEIEQPGGTSYKVRIAREGEWLLLFGDNGQSDRLRRDVSCTFSICAWQLNPETMEYELKSGYGGYHTAIPCEFYKPESLDLGQRINIKTTTHDRDSVAFTVRLNHSEKQLVARSDASFVDFENSRWRVEIVLQNISVSPFMPEDQRLSGPVQLYALDPNPVPPTTTMDQVQNWKIIDQTELTDVDLISRIKSQLVDSTNFGLLGADCFDPRDAIRFGEGSEATDLVICRECGWVYVYSKDSAGKSFRLEYGLGNGLHELIKELREQHFPDLPDK